MAVAAAVQGGYLRSNFQRSPTTAADIHSNRTPRRPSPPISISTNPSHVDPHHLRDLYGLCNHSCHRFPNLDSDGRVQPVDLHKLRIALSHSSVIVSVFSRPDVVTYYSSFSTSSSLPRISNAMSVGGDWFRRVMPVTPSTGQLVGFGRAFSDSGLTASIYDVMVLPPLRGMGIGQMIVNRILRVLTSRGIYDISALCSEEERLFFKACGFGKDILESTTMMYARTISSSDENQTVHRAGRKLLLVPPVKEPFKSYV